LSLPACIKALTDPTQRSDAKELAQLMRSFWWKAETLRTVQCWLRLLSQKPSIPGQHRTASASAYTWNLW